MSEFLIHDGLEGFRHQFTCAWHGQFTAVAPYIAAGQPVMYAICAGCVAENLKVVKTPVGLVRMGFVTQLSCDCHTQRH